MSAPSCAAAGDWQGALGSRRRLRHPQDDPFKLRLLECLPDEVECKSIATSASATVDRAVACLHASRQRYQIYHRCDACAGRSQLMSTYCSSCSCTIRYMYMYMYRVRICNVQVGACRYGTLQQYELLPRR